MTKDQLEVLATIYSANVDRFYEKQAVILQSYLRLVVTPEYRRSEAGKAKLANVRAIMDRLADGCTTGQDACNAMLDAMAQGAE